MSNLNAIRIVALLHMARKNGIKWPILRAETSADRLIRLSLTGPDSREPGSVSVTNGDRETYYGTIHKNGDFETGRFPTDIAECLLDINRDPVEFARLYGQRTGRCCFCGRKLTNKNSITLGYGPICADKWGIYHSYEKGAVEGSDVHAKPSEILAAATSPEHKKALLAGQLKAERSRVRTTKREASNENKLSEIDNALDGVDQKPVTPVYMQPGKDEQAKGRLMRSDEAEMQRMEAEGDRAQTIREETAKAEWKRSVES